MTKPMQDVANQDTWEADFRAPLLSLPGVVLLGLGALAMLFSLTA